MKSISAIGILVVLSMLLPIELALANDSDCWKKRGEAQLQACNRIIQSKRLFDKPISLNNLVVIYNNLGNALKRKGLYDQAIKDYDSALRINPNYSIAYHGRGIAYRNKGFNNRAIQDFNKALQLNPNYQFA